MSSKLPTTPSHPKKILFHLLEAINFLVRRYDSLVPPSQMLSQTQFKCCSTHEDLTWKESSEHDLMNLGVCHEAD